jgi:signal transduction histidine kinase
VGYLIFARISEYYVLLDDELPVLEVSPGNSQFFSSDLIKSMVAVDKSIFTVAELTEIFGKALALTGTHYVFKHFAKYCLLIPVTSVNRLLPVIKEKQIESISIEAERRAAMFRLQTKTRLIDALFSSDTSLGDYVHAWAEYLFCDLYSLWIYNKYTEAFTCSAASFEYRKDYIFRSENSSLNSVLKEGYQPESRPPRRDRANYEQTRDMKTLNRIKLNLGFDGTIGVLTFYSRHEKFALNAGNNEEISNSLETKYLQVRQLARHTMNEVNQHFIETYETGNLDQFLYKLAGLVCDKYQCEACSIFLLEPNKRSLRLAATQDREQSGKPDKDVIYSLGQNSPTVNAFKTRKVEFCYDVSVEDKSAKSYTEITRSQPRNWLALPLYNGETSLGVLRVMNKYEVGSDHTRIPQNFRTSDIVNLTSLCANLSHLIRIENLFDETQRKLDATSASMDEMQDFNKVFLHEIRTPISKFTMAPEIIKRTLKKKELTDEAREKVMKQLDDIQVMGDRLEFVAKTFNFNQIVTRRYFETLSVLGDIVFPVVNITRGYLRKQYDKDIQLDAGPLHSCRVYGDKTLLNIVFNTLIDNAGKYSLGTRKPITVSGGYEANGDFFRLEVSNYGLPIHEDETEQLFDKGFRGGEAIRQGIGGTGIGLHLASRIMHEGNGELLLTSLADPVTFVIRIPAKPKGSKR